MIGFLNPLLLLGLLGIALPILIHLLLRQRPRPRPWAAMVWLRAAMVAAQRRYRLTNLLLLFLRCLIVALIAFAVARPAITGWGQSGEVVLVVDFSTSMGPTSAGSPLATLAAQLAAAEHIPDRMTLITLGREVLLRHRGSGAEGLRVLERLEVETWAGGVDDFAQGAAAQTLIDLIPPQSRVVIVSDFRQDRGEGMVELLTPVVERVDRLRVGEDSPNALIVDLDVSDDLLPRQAGSIRLRIQGQAQGARVRIGDGAFERVRLSESEEGDWHRLQLPPLAAGQHLLSVALDNEGLLADNQIEVPLLVRSRIPTMAMSEDSDFVDIALQADSQRIDHQRVSPLAAAATPLPARGGAIVVRGVPPASVSLFEWLREGGVLWGAWSQLAEDPELAALLDQQLRREEAAADGRLQSGFQDLDENFARTRLSGLDALHALAADSPVEVLLRAGESPLVVAMPVAAGWLVVEADDLIAAADLRTTGATPEWVVRNVRRLTMRIHHLQHLRSGYRAEHSTQVERAGEVVQVHAGEPAHLRPGWWRASSTAVEAGQRGLVVVPNPEEGVLRAQPGTAAWNNLAILTEQGRGADWAWWLLLALLLVLFGEGAIAAWAGRTYGR